MLICQFDITGISGRKNNGGTILLNVGGTIHQVKWDTIDKFPKSRLQKLRYATTDGEIIITAHRALLVTHLYISAVEILALCDSFSLENREFFFDRSPRIFENILGLYRKGELHLTESVCPRDFLGELEFWGLSALHLGDASLIPNNLFKEHSISYRTMLCLHTSKSVLATSNSGSWGRPGRRG